MGVYCNGTMSSVRVLKNILFSVKPIPKTTELSTVKLESGGGLNCKSLTL